MPSPIQGLRTWAPSREQLEPNRLLRRPAPHLAHPQLWHWSRRGVATGMAIGLFIGFAIPVAQIVLGAAAATVVLRASVAVAAGTAYLLISQAWAWRIAEIRRAARS